MATTTKPISKSAKFWREWRGSFAFLFLMLVFRSAWADWMHVPSGSMNPTIVEGDRILVDKHVYGLRLPWTLIRLTDGREPRRGEIVVFDSPTDGISLVKRLIGEPGDVVALDEEGLVVNGERAHYAPGDVAHLAPMLDSTKTAEPRNYRESGVVAEHDVLDMPYLASREFGPVRVPEGMYLMLGDNRDNSSDSRFIGFVPRRNIVGRASSVPVSFNPENFYLPRRNRWFVPLE
jgi:signal peptidase I